MSNPAQPDQGIQISLQASPVPGPDGRTWVALRLVVGPMITQLTLEPDTAEQIATAFPGVLADAVAAARRANSGIIVADGLSGIDLSKLINNPNGDASGQR
jgi:hypothetical protein